MKKKITLVLLMLWTCIEIGAIQAFKVRKHLTLEDGTLVMATLQGDEFYNYYITDDGRVLNATASGKYRIVSEQAHSRARRMAVERLAETNSLRAKSIRRNTESSDESRHGLVILAQFQDVKFSAQGTQEYFSRMFNEKGFSDNGNTGSVSDYFYDQSYGKLSYEFDVVGPVTLPNPLAYYGAHDEESGDVDTRDLDFAADACTTAQDLVDFSKYDEDNDGIVDNVFILFAGYSEAMGATPECIWPHQWVIWDRNLTIDGKRIYKYACSNELLWSSGEALNGIGTACHEFSHTLGLADTYNTMGGNSPVGQWDVMSGGSYLGEPYGSCGSPISYTAYERWALGWLEPTELNEETTVTDMKPIEDYAEAYVMYNEANRDEYYLLENRQLQKWGKVIGSHGLMVTHVDYDEWAWFRNRVNNDDAHPRFAVVSACEDVNDYNGTLFPGTTGNTLLTNNSTPAATLFNPNDDGTYFLNKPVENISESDEGTISFVACTGIAKRYDREIKAKLNSDGTIACQWDAVQDAVSYDVELSAKTTQPSPYNHAIIDETFNNVPKEDGTEDISSLLEEYIGIDWDGYDVYTALNGIRINSYGVFGTEIFKVWETNNATFVFDMSPYVNGQTTKGCISIYTIDGKNIATWDISLDKQQKLIFNASLEKGQNYYLFFDSFNAPVCISGISVYDGLYDEEDFTREDQPSLSEETLTPEQVNTADNSVVFSGIQKGYNYSVRVRSNLSDGRTSIWSLPVDVDMTSGIESVTSDALPSWDGKNVIYDITGRRVTSKSRPGIYIQNRQKIVWR